MRKFKGCLEVVDVSDKLPELKRVPGVTKWELLNRKGNPVHSFAEAPESSTKFVDSVFQPSEEEAEWMHLERCLRLLPHYQDTGGFFVTVLRKTAPSSAKEARRVAAAEKAASEGPAGESDAAAPASVEGEAPAPADAALQGDVTAPEEPRKKSRGRVFKEDPFLCVVTGTFPRPSSFVHSAPRALPSPKATTAARLDRSPAWALAIV